MFHFIRAWVGPLHIVRNRRARRFAFSTILLLFAAACFPGGTEDVTDSDPSASAADGLDPRNEATDGVVTGSDETDIAAEEEESDSVFSRRPERLIVELEVHRVEAPAGVFGEEAPIWEIVREPFPDAARLLRLRANGMLAAVGRDSDRMDLLAYLESLPKPAVATDRVMPDSSRLVDVEVGVQEGRLTLFHYDEAGTLRGLELEEPQARFRIRCEFRSSNLRDVWLEVMPELEEPPGAPKWVIGPDERARQIPTERKHTFGSAAFGVEIPKGGFLLLGATSAVHERPLLARPFFLKGAGETKDGRMRYRESIYVIRPIVRAVPVAEEGDAAAEE